MCVASGSIPTISLKSKPTTLKEKRDNSRREEKKGRTTRQPITDGQGINGRERQIKQTRERGFFNESILFRLVRFQGIKRKKEGKS